MADVRNSLLEKLYEAYYLPSGLSSVNKLYKAAKILDNTITINDVKLFLEGKDSYTLHNITPKKFLRRKMVAPRPRVIIACDLADVKELSKYNNGVNYLLVCLDMFSRYLKVVTLKRKNAVSLYAAMKKIMESDEFHGVSRVFTDRGSEFYNRLLKNYLSKKGAHLYSTSSYEIKSSLAERVIRTLKGKIYKYLTSRNTHKYLDALKGLVESYNNSTHRGLGGEFTPIEVHGWRDKRMIKMLFSKMYKTGQRGNIINSKTLAIGRTVRLADSGKQSKFRRGYKTQNTTEIFKIARVDKKQYPQAYYLEDLAGEKIDGIFYREELTPTVLPKTYQIQILKKKKIQGRYKYLVSWVGYPTTFDSWVNEEDIEYLKHNE